MDSSDTQHRCHALQDAYERKIEYVRLAVTSRCNLRCVYCMKEEHSTQSNPEDELSREEIGRIIEVLADAGIRKVRFTGGEPLLRDDIVALVRHAKSVCGIETVSLTTNGVLLDRYLDRLLEAKLDGVNLSLDTLESERYRRLTRRDLFGRVAANLDALLRKDNSLQVKINVVLLRSINSHELERFTELTRQAAITVRFMELMPFDDHQIWRTGRFMSVDKILEALRRLYPNLAFFQGHATEHFTFSLPGYRGKLAIIPAFTRNFCSTCNRLRITATGGVRSCLYSREEVDLLPVLRNSAGNEQIITLLHEALRKKPRDGREAGNTARGTSMSEIGG